jgi:hypothetical protein
MIMPGSIKVTTETVRAHLPGLDAKIVAHIEEWVASVPVGTTLTISKMLNCNSTCGCPPHLTHWKCKAPRKGFPMEIVMEHLFPLDGSPCAIDGVKMLTMHGPGVFASLGHPKYIQKVPTNNS